ncbi:hypothetical protein GCM10009098_02490 [Rheinheimera aquimaris]|uniref:Uncharacterized protein n=1 Tax=Rheinheimera aquimaris TaxID=412437 RepID=A0ABN1DAE3_9GAMM
MVLAAWLASSNRMKIFIYELTRETGQQINRYLLYANSVSFNNKFFMLNVTG